ncbi:unnamed protein product [Mytilus coruscus]|uniref:Uncharacterized protein n=1 Tax=Mytilus coruscus TaxID=42192 RepID=A0A6J8C9P6_MYTCO|nr:unnamed protein product [Mytilus coruscus]
MKHRKRKDNDEIKIVVGIDLGTTYSGYAFSSTESFDKRPLDIKLNDDWISGSGGLISFKTPTSVLLYKDGTCREFGYDAENEYTNQILDKQDQQEDQDTDFFFHRFKMKLYENEDFSDNWNLEDIKGRKLPAIDVFSAALSKLTFCIKCKIKNNNPDIQDNSIKWILTVPAIWTHKAKEFMRRAAEKLRVAVKILVLTLQWCGIRSVVVKILVLTLQCCGIRWVAVKIPVLTLQCCVIRWVAVKILVRTSQCCGIRWVAVKILVLTLQCCGIRWVAVNIPVLTLQCCDIGWVAVKIPVLTLQCCDIGWVADKIPVLTLQSCDIGWVAVKIPVLTLQNNGIR